MSHPMPDPRRSGLAEALARMAQRGPSRDEYAEFLAWRAQNEVLDRPQGELVDVLRARRRPILRDYDMGQGGGVTVANDRGWTPR